MTILARREVEAVPASSALDERVLEAQPTHLQGQWGSGLVMARRMGMSTRVRRAARTTPTRSGGSRLMNERIATSFSAVRRSRWFGLMSLLYASIALMRVCCTSGQLSLCKHTRVRCAPPITTANAA